MQKTNTVSDIFKTAISLEKRAEAFYYGLANMFSHNPEVSEFWKIMMKDEIYHAQVLQKKLDSLTEEQTSVQVDMLGIGYSDEEMRMFSSLCDLTGTENLEDAYDKAYRLESSEINSKAKSLIKEFMTSEEMINFILSVLEKHVSKLEEFSKSFGDEEIMRSILTKTD